MTARCARCAALAPSMCADHVLSDLAARRAAHRKDKPKMTKQPRGAATAYVRALPITMPVDEVVRRARLDGVKVSVATVYSARSYKPRAPVRPPPARPAPAPRPPEVETVFNRIRPAGRRPASKEEAVFLALAARLGYDRAQALLAGAMDHWVDRALAAH